VSRRVAAKQRIEAPPCRAITARAAPSSLDARGSDKQGQGPRRSLKRSSGHRDGAGAASVQCVFHEKRSSLWRATPRVTPSRPVSRRVGCEAAVSRRHPAAPSPLALRPPR